MTDTPPKQPTFRKLVLVGIIAFAVGAAAGYALYWYLETRDPGDTPILVRDGSIVITSVGADLDGFGKPDPKVRIHPRVKARLGRLMVDGQSKGVPCHNSIECEVEFLWSTGTPGQPDYQEYTVVVESNTGNGRTAGIVSSVPFPDYDSSEAQNPETGRMEYTYTWSPTEPLTFREARLRIVPLGDSTAKPAPQVLCSNPGCKIEFEYK